MSFLDRFEQQLTARPIYIFLFILLFCLAGYGNTLSYPFLMDDHLVLWGQEGVENRTLISLFTSLQGGDFYRPVGHVILWVCHRLFAESYTLYHAVNLLLLAVVGFLFFLIVVSLFGDRRIALLTAVLYVTHPINNMLVNYITVTVITTYILAMQLCLIFFLKGIDTGQQKYHHYSLSFMVLALLSHEMAIWCPVYLWAVAYFARNRSLREALRCIWPWLAIAVAFVILRKFFFGFGDMLRVVIAVMSQVPVYISSLTDLVAWYLSKLVVPIDYIFLWTQPISFEMPITRSFQAIGITAVLLYFIFKRWARGPLSFGMFVLVCGFLPIGVASYAYWPWYEPFIEPHWFYFSSIGFYLAAGYGLAVLSRRLPAPIWMLAVAFVLVYNIGLLKLNNVFWKDQKTYCRYWISLNKFNMTPYYWLGRSSLNEGDHRAAIGHFRDGLKVLPEGNQYLWADLGYAHLLNGDNETAMELLRHTVEQWPFYARTYFYLALFHLNNEDLKRAQAAIDLALKYYPRSKLYQRYASEIKQKSQNDK